MYWGVPGDKASACTQKRWARTETCCENKKQEKYFAVIITELQAVEPAGQITDRALSRACAWRGGERELGGARGSG